VVVVAVGPVGPEEVTPEEAVEVLVAGAAVVSVLPEEAEAPAGAAVFVVGGDPSESGKKCTKNKEHFNHNIKIQLNKL
jgi:hypothetical protein